MGKLGPREEMEAHLCRGSPVCSAALPGAMTHPPALSACVMEGESLLASGSCWSLLEGRLLCMCSHPGQSCSGMETGPGRPRATLPLPRSGGAGNASEARTTPGGLCLVCADAAVIAGKWITRLVAQFLPLMLPALSQLPVFKSHELSRLGTSCNLAETSKKNPDVAGSAVRLGQPRTNSVLVGAMALLASSRPNRKANFNFLVACGH